MRTGAGYLASIQDGRAVYLDGQRVADVVSHPAFSAVATTVAGLYDYAADPANGMIRTDPQQGFEYNKGFLIPYSRQDLEERRTAVEKWARRTYGLLGRGPEHVGSFFAGFASDPGYFARRGAEFGQNVLRFNRRIQEESLYVSYCIVPPVIDRSKTAQHQEEAFLQVGAVAERDDGIVVRGAQMLGTAALLSNYVFISCIQPLKPGDEPYALSFVVPVGAPGLKLYCRPPYALNRPSVYDYPLSTRFDETDAFAVFEDVFIPWEDVFIYRDIEMVRGQFFETPAHLLGNHQAQIRLSVKLKFITGLARKVTAQTKVDHIPGVQERLSELAALAATVEGMILASEATCVTGKTGAVRPNPRFLYSPVALQSEVYNRAVNILRDLSGGAILQVPSSYRDLISPETAPDMLRYLRAPGIGAKERIKLYRLIWDFIGTEFAGRHLQYEMFYQGAPYQAKTYLFRTYGYEEAVALVDDCLSGYDLPED